MNGDLSKNSVIKQKVRKSYLHGASNVELLFDTIGDRLRYAASQVLSFFLPKIFLTFSICNFDYLIMK